MDGPQSELKVGYDHIHELNPKDAANVIIKGLIERKFPDHDGIVKSFQTTDNVNRDSLATWGVGFELAQTLNSGLFKFNRLMFKIVTKAKKAVRKSNDQRGQFTLDYKNDGWELKLDYYNDSCDGGLDDRFSLKITMSLSTVQQLIFELLTSGVKLYDINACPIYN